MEDFQLDWLCYWNNTFMSWLCDFEEPPNRTSEIYYPGPLNWVWPYDLLWSMKCCQRQQCASSQPIISDKSQVSICLHIVRLFTIRITCVRKLHNLDWKIMWNKSVLNLQSGMKFNRCQANRKSSTDLWPRKKFCFQTLFGFVFLFLFLFIYFLQLKTK